jgi:Pyridoxamine 5'-phosphate oxidase
MRETEPNPIDAALAAFLESPVMIIVGSCDDGLMPQIARAAGAIVDRGKGSIDLIVSGWQWPQTIADVSRNGRLAVTFARPADYVSYQVKGRAAVIPASAAHRQCAQHYIEAMTQTFVGLGLDRAVAAPWLVDLEPQVLRLGVETIFVQTPGEKAGHVLEPSP